MTDYHDQLDAGLAALLPEVKRGLLDPEALTTVKAKPNVFELQGKFMNPFFVSLRGGPLMQTEMSKVYPEHSKVFFLCMKKGSEQEVIEHILSAPELTKENFLALARMTQLVSASSKVLKNPTHKKNSAFVDDNYLKHFEHDGVLQMSNIVIPAYNIHSTTVEQYRELYESTHTFDNICRLLQLYNFFNGNTHPPTREKILDMIIEMNGSDYWRNQYNCQLSITSTFESRKFTRPKYNTSNQNVIKIQHILDELETRGDVDYLPTEDDGIQFDNSAVHQKDKRRYYITNVPTSITKDQIVDWISSLSDVKMQFSLFTAFAVNKDHCHLVFNNPKVLEFMAPVFAKSMPLLRYVMSRGWLALHMEETIKRTRTTPQDRYIFTIDTASKLPLFPYDVTNVNSNPYTPFPVKKSVISNSENYLGLPMVLDPSKFEGYGISTLAEFKKKFGIFTTGSDKMGTLFDGLKWGDRYAVSGSVMPPCVQKDSLLADILPANNNEERIQTMFANLYGGADIDMMCKFSNNMEFVKGSSYLIEVIKKNLERIHDKEMKIGGPTQQKCDATIECKKSVIVTMNRKYIEAMTDESYESVVKSLDSAELRGEIYSTFVNYKVNEGSKERRANREEMKKDKVFADLLNMYLDILPMSDIQLNDIGDDEIDGYMTDEQRAKSDVVLRLRLSEVTGNEPAEGEADPYVLKIVEGIKYKVNSAKYMNHPIEIFRIKGDFWTVVSRFHLPCVRMYYNGDNVFMLPSSIGAVMTNTNTDYKYFAGVRDPPQIISKYRSRGFTTLLNKTERGQMVKYNAEFAEFPGMYKVDLKDGGSIKRHFSPQKLDSEIYRVMKYREQTPNNVYIEPKYQYITSQEDIVQMYRLKFGYDAAKSDVKYLDMPFVDDEGNVVPLKKWVVQAGIDEFFE
jgi:hypothetical protein